MPATTDFTIFPCFCFHYSHFINRYNIKGKLSVIQKNSVCFTHIIGESLIVYCDNFLLTGNRITVRAEDYFISFFNSNRSLHVTGTNLCSFCIKHDTNGNRSIFIKFLENRYSFFVILSLTMGKIDARHIHTCISECGNLFRRKTGWP